MPGRETPTWPRCCSANDIVWLHPEGRPMGEGDWHDGRQKSLGMYLNGPGVAGLDATGNRIVDDHFLLFLSGGSEDVTVVLPPEEYSPARLAPRAGRQE